MVLLHFLFVIDLDLAVDDIVYDLEHLNDVVILHDFFDFVI